MAQQTVPVTDLDEIRLAADVLKSTERGRRIAKQLYELLNGDGLGLDRDGQTAVQMLLGHAWNSLPGTVLDHLRTD